MTAQFPTALVTTTNIPDANPLTTLSANNHAGKHNDMRDEIVAIEAKVGKDSSAVATSHDYKLSGVTGTDKATGATQTVTMTNKTLSSPKVTVGSDAIGDTLYNSSGATGVQSRVAIGTSGQVLTSNGTNPFWSSPSTTNTNYVADSGAANVYVATLSPALGAYTAGVLVQFKATNANTTASTVNVNGLGVKTIKKLGGATDLVSGDIAAGMIVELEYDGTNFIMLNPVANIPLTSTSDGSALTNIPHRLQTVTTDVAIASSTTETTLITQSIPGGTLGTANYVRAVFYITVLRMATGTGDTCTFRIKYGATTLITDATFNGGGAGNIVWSGRMEVVLAGAGTTGTQNATMTYSISPLYVGNGNVVGAQFSTTTQGTSSEDSTAAKTFAVTAQMSANNANDQITVALITLESVA